jgi:hypothetical protein
MNISKTTVLGAVSKDAWCVYADGFRRAAEILMNNVNTTYEVNTVCFPIIALIRHYVELTLKEIIAYGQYIDDHDVKQGGHDIKKLWAAARAYIRKHLKDLSKEEEKIIETFVNDLYVLDPTSESTRYPCIKEKGSPDGRSRSFSNGQVWINFEEWKMKVDKTKNIFDNITMSLSVLKDLKSEFISEYLP